MKYVINTIKFIVNSITTIIIAIGIILVILLAVGIQPFVVESGSMEPAIKTGSLCFVNKRAKYEEMQVGDIIAFKLKTGASATHRIVEKNEKGLVTKGDANAGVDSVVITEDTFLGKNIFAIPKVGFFVKTLQTPSGKIIVGTLVLVIFLAGILLGEPSKKKCKNVDDKDIEKKDDENNNKKQNL